MQRRRRDLNGVFNAADVNDSIDQQAVLPLSPGGWGDNRGGALSCGASGATAGARIHSPVKLVWRHHLGDTTLPALPGEIPFSSLQSQIVQYQVSEFHAHL